MIWLSLAGKWLAGLPRWVWYALGVIILAWALVHYGDRKGYARGHAELVKFQAQVADDIAKQEAANKAKELKDRLAFEAAATLLEKRNAETQANADRTIAELRGNKLRVRDNLKCPASATKIAGSAEGDNDSGGAYVSRENQEFFLRLGAEADGVVNRLTACQNILKAERITE